MLISRATVARRTTVVNRFSNILLKSHNATQRQLEVLQRYNSNCIQAASSIDPTQDQALYVDYNKRPFFAPPEFTFEPCTIWHDDENMSLEVEPKTFLQNKLSREEGELANIAPRVEAMRREVTRLEDLRKSYTENPALGDLDSVVENYFDSVREVVFLESEQATLEAEIELLKDTLAGDTGGNGNPHNFKLSSFPVAKHCYVCQGKIWGMSKAGLSCRDCNIALHTGCELKCPADCGDPSLELQRSQTRASMAPSDVHSRTASFDGGSSLSKRASIAPSLRSNGSSLSISGSGGKGSAKAKYDYPATSAAQLSITKGETLTVVTEDTGNGWTKVSNNQGNTGIVPTTYIDIIPASSSNGAAPPPLSRRPDSTSEGPSGGTVTAVYAYSAGSARELSISPGEVLSLTAKGSSFAPGWTEVTQNGKRGIVPTSYVK